MKCCPFCNATSDHLIAENVAKDSGNRALWAVICVGCYASGPFVLGGKSAAWDAWGVRFGDFEVTS